MSFLVLLNLLLTDIRPKDVYLLRVLMSRKINVYRGTEKMVWLSRYNKSLGFIIAALSTKKMFFSSYFATGCDVLHSPWCPSNNGCYVQLPPTEEPASAGFFAAAGRQNPTYWYISRAMLGLVIIPCKEHQSCTKDLQASFFRPIT